MQFTYYSTEKTYTYNLQGTLVIGPQGPKGDSYEVLIKDGYEWAKGIVDGTKNTDEDEYELYDRIKGVGDFYPDYILEGYITTVPMVDPETDITYTQMIPLP